MVVIYPDLFVYRYVKLISISHPLVEPGLYQLAVQTSTHLEKLHPGGKIVEGVSDIKIIWITWHNKIVYDSI